MNQKQLIELLYQQGFDNGWAIAGETLVLWEHDADPPAPLTRPEASDVVAD